MKIVKNLTRKNLITVKKRESREKREDMKIKLASVRRAFFTKLRAPNPELFLRRKIHFSKNIKK